MERRFGENLFLVVILAVLAGGMYILAPTGLQSNEEGVYQVQMKNLALTGFSEIDWPGFAFGFEAKDLAGQQGFFESRNGRLYAVTSPLFPFIASLFYPLFGDRTVDFTPILFLFLSTLVLCLILDRVMPREFF